MRRPLALTSPLRAIALSVRDTVSRHDPTMRASSDWVGTGARIQPVLAGPRRPCGRLAHVIRCPGPVATAIGPPERGLGRGGNEGGKHAR